MRDARVRVIEELREFTENRFTHRWDRLGPGGALHSALVSAVIESDAEFLNACWSVIDRDLGAVIRALVIRHARAPAGSELDVERVAYNLKALVASARAAEAYRRLRPAEGDPADPAATIVRMLGETGYLDRQPSAIHWARQFADQTGNLDCQVTVPIAGIAGEHAFLAAFSVRRLDQSTDAVLVEAPKTALRLLGQQLLRVIEAAWERACRQGLRGTAQWEVRLWPSTAEGNHLALDGDSLELACVAAFELLRRGEHGRKQVLLLGRVGSDGRSVQPVGHQLEKLSIAAKSLSLPDPQAHVDRAVISARTHQQPQGADYSQLPIAVQEVDTVGEAIQLVLGTSCTNSRAVGFAASTAGQLLAFALTATASTAAISIAALRGFSPLGPATLLTAAMAVATTTLSRSLADRRRRSPQVTASPGHRLREATVSSLAVAVAGATLVLTMLWPPVDPLGELVRMGWEVEESWEVDEPTEAQALSIDPPPQRELRPPRRSRLFEPDFVAMEPEVLRYLRRVNTEGVVFNMTDSSMWDIVGRLTAPLAIKLEPATSNLRPDAERLRLLPNIRSLSLQYNGRRGDLALLPLMPHLETLEITGCTFTDEGDWFPPANAIPWFDLESLARLPQLRALTLHVSQCSDGLDVQRRPCRSEWGSTHDCRFVPVNAYLPAATLPALPDLEVLHIYGAPLRDLSVISTFPKLKRLSLVRPRNGSFEDRLVSWDLRPLAPLAELDRLAVTGGGRPDLDKFADSIGYVEMDLAPLAALSHLKILESTTSTDLAALAGLRLEHLTVDVAGDSLAALSTQTALKTLSILCKYCESFRLPSLPNLTVLQATAGFDEAPLVLPQSLIDLHLEKACCRDASLNSKPLAALTELRHLELTHLSLSDLRLQSLHRLETLDIISLVHSGPFQLGVPRSPNALRRVSLRNVSLVDVAPLLAATRLESFETSQADIEPGPLLSLPSLRALRVPRPVYERVMSSGAASQDLKVVVIDDATQ